MLGDAAPTAAQLTGELPELEMVLDETLRLYPAAWVGPRRAVETFEFGGHEVPAGAYVNYSSWASHRLPDVWPDPEAFVPERFAPERKAQLPKGAYVPFGGGSRTCIGMRFGQLEIKTIVTLLLQRYRLELVPGRTMTVRQMPTLSPREPLQMMARPRCPPIGDIPPILLRMAERDAPFTTLSGEPIEPLYTEADLPAPEQIGLPGRVPVHARRVPDRCTAGGCGRCGSSPASAPPRRPTSASATCSTTGRRASRRRSTCRR